MINIGKLKVISGKEEVFKSGSMVQDMKDIGRTIKQMEEAD